MQNQITAEGPEVVDVETDQLDGSGKGFKYKPRYQQYCSNCGGQGHNYFLCKGGRMKQPAFFPNKPFVIQELQAPLIDFTKTVITSTPSKPAVTSIVSETEGTSTATKTVPSSTVPTNPSPTLTVPSDRKAPSQVPLPTKNSKKNTTTRVSDRADPKPTEASPAPPVTSFDSSEPPRSELNPFPFGNNFSYQPQLNMQNEFSPLHAPSWQGASCPFTTAQGNQDKNNGVAPNYASDDVPTFFTPFDRPIQPETLIQFPEAFRQPPPLPAFTTGKSNHFENWFYSSFDFMNSKLRSKSCFRFGILCIRKRKSLRYV